MEFKKIKLRSLNGKPLRESVLRNDIYRVVSTALDGIHAGGISPSTSEREVDFCTMSGEYLIYGMMVEPITNILMQQRRGLFE